MRIVDRFPRAVETIEHTWIPMTDGCRLAARIWRPVDALEQPVPAILEYLPYRKRDGTVERDDCTHPYLAGHGFACVRVDIRGNGESDGLMLDEYLKQEQDDALEIIDWLTEQPWCDGNVGMMGISWGGFNALQVAARRPPALKAIITLCSTDDRYADDIHYKGGALLTENLGWASTMFAGSSLPPDPELAGERWRDIWLERLEATPLLIENWLRHQRRDVYWKHGSVCEDFSAIQAATWAVGGWGDAYSNAILRLCKGLEAPVRGLIGPWVHKYPHIAVPEPAIDFLGESLRWWDRWLKGADNDVMSEPLVRAYLYESVRPQASYAVREGRWVAAHDWPDAKVAAQRFPLAPGRLGGAPEQATLAVSSPQSTGAACGEYCAMWLGPEWPAEQREDDAGSLCFDTAPLAERVEILGAPVATLELAADRPRALVVVRLCDVGPLGESTRVSYGVLNLCHRESHEQPSALEPGCRYRVRVALDDVGYAFPPGHRIRLALSSAYWPLIWPSPEPVTLELETAESELLLPVYRGPDEPLRAFTPPVGAPPTPIATLREPCHRRTFERDFGSGETRVHVLDDFGERRLESHGLATGAVARETYSIHPDDPLSARADIAWTTTMGRGEWRVRTETHTVLVADRERFHIRARLEAFEGERSAFTRTWERAVLRDFL